MKKISITYTFYEYMNLKTLRDIPYYSGLTHTINIEMKDMIWDVFNYTFFKIKTSTNDLHAFLNLFFKKYNLPLFKDKYQEMISSKTDESLFSADSNPILYPNSVYILRLTDFDLTQLNEMLKIISEFSLDPKKISYSEILRTCLHFITDYKMHKYALSSLVYVGIAMTFPFYIPLSELLIDKPSEKLSKVKINYYNDDIIMFKKRISGKTFRQLAVETHEMAKAMEYRTKDLTREDRVFFILFHYYAGYVALRWQMLSNSINIPGLITAFYVSGGIPDDLLKAAPDDFINALLTCLDMFLKRK